MDERTHIDRRAGHCYLCGRAGTHVDTTCDEIVEYGVVVARVTDGRTLMADGSHGLTCDECHEDREEAGHDDD